MSLFPIAGAAARGTQRRPSQPTAPPDDRSLIRRAGDAALGGIAVAGNILDVPGSMARDTIAGLATGNWNKYNPFDQLLSPHTSENRATGRDLNRMAGLAGPQDTWGNFAGGLATEILTDPTSFMHFGSAAASRGGQAAARSNMLDDVMQIASQKYNMSQNATLAQQGRKALKGAEIVRGNKIGPRQAQMMVTLDDLMQAASPAKRQALGDVAEKAGVNIAEQGPRPLGGLVGIAPAPFMDPRWTFGTGPRAQKAAAFLDEWSPNPLNPGRRIMDFEVPGTGKAPIRAAYNLLDRTLKEATTPFTRELARGLTKSQDEARAQARGAVAGFANRLVKLGKATDQEADELRQLFEVPEARAQASPELRQFADDVENELTDLLQQSQARGIKLELLDDEWIKYFPRFFADSFTGKKSGQSVFSTFTESALKREDFLRNIQGGTVRIKQILRDVDLNEAIDGGKSLPFISNLLRQKYGAEVPEDSIDSFASWMRELAPEQRAAGGFANHPLVDLQARLMSGRDSIAAADKVYEALLEPGVLKSTVEPGGVKVGEIFSENRFNVENAKEILASKLNEQAGQDIFTKRSFDHMYVDKPTAQWLRSFIDGFNNPKPASEILEVFDSLQNSWKWAMIGPWPSRYTRDFTSGQMNNVFAGTFSWRSLWDGIRAMFGYDIKGAKDIPVVQRLAQQRGYDIDVNDIPFPTGGERDRVFQQAQQVFGDDAEHAVALMDANAKLWARETGQSADEWFKRIKEIRRGKPEDVGPDALDQPLYQGEYTVPFGRRGASSEAADKLNAAEQMAAKGTPADDIKRETGWYKGKDGVWRNDVVSGDTVLLIGAESPIGSDLGKKTALLREVVDAPWLFSNYPELADYKVRVAAKNFKSRADIDVHNKVIRVHPDETGEKLRDTLIHEATHHIQATEGFGRDYVSSRGASQYTGIASEKIAALKKRRDEIHIIPKGYSVSGRYINYSLEDDGGLTDEAARRWRDIDGQIEEIQRQQRYVRKLVEQKSYWESQSEIEARMAENSQINTESVLKKYDDAITGASAELQKRLDTADKLLYQPRGASGPRGAVQFEQDGRAVITAFQSADISTLVHETGHIFRRTLGEIDQKLLSEAEAALGVTGGNWDRAAEEAFASGFERYVRDGQAPTSALKRAFERLKTWLMDIYRSIVGTPLEQSVSPELKQVFDDMLGGGRNARPVLDDKAATEIIGELAYAYSVLGKYEGEAQSVAGQAPESIGKSVNDIYSEMLGGGRQQANLLRTGQKLVAWPGSGTTYNPLKARLRGVFGSEKSTLGVAAAGEDVGHMVEGFNRLAPFIKQLREGVDPAVAAAKVGGAQVQYANRYYTKFQQDVLARVFPFAKYTMGMTPWVLRQLSENPGGAMGATIKAANRAHNPDELTPDYVADTAAIPVQGTPLESLLGQPGEPGTNRYLTGFGMSFEDPLSFIGSTGVRGAMGEAISRMSPPVKAIPEWAAGESFFQRGPMGGRDLDDMDPLVGRLISNVKQAVTGEEHKFPVRLPEWFEYLAANSPASRALSTARTIADPRKSAAGKAVNLLTGFRITDVSPASQTALIADRAETLMRQMGARQFSRTYFPDDVRRGMTPEELAVAMQLEALQKFVDKARKERNRQSAKN